MKKLFVTMLAVAATATSFAQNPDALKQVMAAEKRSDASKIMKEQGSTMAPYERVKGYSYIVDKALKDNSDAQGKAMLAQGDEKTKQQTKQYKAAYDGLKYAMEAVPDDDQPNEKGKVSPKFKKKYASKVVALRNDLIQGALGAYNSKDYATAEKWFGLFVDSHSNALFAEDKTVQEEKNYGEVAYFAGLSAYFNKDYKKAAKYCQIAQKAGDAQSAADALKLELSAYDGAKQAGQMDDEALLKKYKEVYKANPSNSDVFGRYVGALYNANKKEEAEKLLANRLKTDPNDIMANAYLGQSAQEIADKATDEATALKKYEEAIASYEKVIAAKPDFDAVKYNLAVCYRAQAMLLKNGNKPYKDILAKAKTLFLEVQKKDPDEQQFKTKYILSQIDQL